MEVVKNETEEERWERLVADPDFRGYMDDYLVAREKILAAMLKVTLPYHSDRFPFPLFEDDIERHAAALSACWPKFTQEAVRRHLAEALIGCLRNRMKVMEAQIADISDWDKEVRRQRQPKAME